MDIVEAVRDQVGQVTESLRLLDSSLATLDQEAVVPTECARWLLILADINRDIECLTADVRGEHEECEEEEAS